MSCRGPDHVHPQRSRGRGRGNPAGASPNGELLRDLDAITPGGLMVRRALDVDPVTGRRRWTDRQFLFGHFQDAELGYAVTDHAAQGRTVHTRLALITGTEDRQHAYNVALTRGTNDNTAQTSTPSRPGAPTPRPAPGPRLNSTATTASRGKPLPRTNQPTRRLEKKAGRDPLGVLAEVLGRDSQAAVGLPSQGTGAGRRRPPGHPARHLDRRDQPRPATALPGTARSRPSAAVPARAEPQGAMAVADAAQRRTGRAGRPRRSWPTRLASGA